MPTLSEAASKQLLARYGVPVLDERTAPSADPAVSAADAIGYPVVVKLCGDTIAHKTERGLVRLGLRDADAVRAAAAQLLATPGPTTATVELLVAPMVRGTRELIAGLVRDPQFGPCVMLGVGGVLAEALGDVAFRVVPVADARRRRADRRPRRPEAARPVPRRAAGRPRRVARESFSACPGSRPNDPTSPRSTSTR